MENFFNWMTKQLPDEDVLVWFNVHNMNYENIELYGDIYKSLYFLITDTYLGNENQETKINLSSDDKKAHFDWCWEKLISDFGKENIRIKLEGKHKDYFLNFFFESFYEKKEDDIQIEIEGFIQEIFDLNKKFTKSDLEILTELYKLLENNVN